MNRTRATHKGIGLVEVVVAAAILVLIVVGVSSAYRLMIRSSAQVLRGTQAQMLAEEGLEAVRIMRDGQWSAIASSTPSVSYTLSWSGALWQLTQTPSLIDAVFDRRIVFARVYRDADDDIAPSGTLDTGMYLVTATVSWNSGYGTTTRSVSSYIGNIFE